MINLLNLTNFNLNKLKLPRNTRYGDHRLYLISFIPTGLIKILMVWRIIITSGFKRLNLWYINRRIDKTQRKIIFFQHKIDEKNNVLVYRSKMSKLKTKLIFLKNRSGNYISINKSLLRYQFNSAVYYKVANFYWILRKEKKLVNESELKKYYDIKNKKTELQNQLNDLLVEKFNKDVNLEVIKQKELDIQTQILDLKQQLQELEQFYEKSQFLDFDLKLLNLLYKHPDWTIDEIFKEYHIDFLSNMRTLWYIPFNNSKNVKRLNDYFNILHTPHGFRNPKPRVLEQEFLKSHYQKHINLEKKQKSKFHKTKSKNKGFSLFWKREVLTINRWSYAKYYEGLNKHWHFVYRLTILFGFIIPLHYFFTGKWIQLIFRGIVSYFAWQYLNSTSGDVNGVSLSNGEFFTQLNNAFFLLDVENLWLLSLTIWYLLGTLVWDWIWLLILKHFRNSTGFFVFAQNSQGKKSVDNMLTYIYSHPAESIYQQ